MRIFLAFLLAAVALAAATYLHQGSKFATTKFDTGLNANGVYASSTRSTTNSSSLASTTPDFGSSSRRHRPEG